MRILKQSHSAKKSQRDSFGFFSIHLLQSIIKLEDIKDFGDIKSFLRKRLTVTKKNRKWDPLH